MSRLMVPYPNWLMIFVFACITICSSCETPDIPSGNSDINSEISDNPSGDEKPDKFSSVTDAMYQFQIGRYDTLLYVCGYVVGVVKGNSIKKALFDLPVDVETNVLLADDPMERNYINCLPVRLEKGTEIREDVNLKLHPENKGRQIVVIAYIEKYFSVAGIRDPIEYAWIDSPSSETDSIPLHLSYPSFKEEEQMILGGR